MMKKSLIFLTVFLGLEYAALPVWAATRVALVSTSGKEAENSVLALAEALLGAQPDIALVERREVEKIFKEQELALSGSGDADKAMVIGKLLGVEVFAVLEIVPDSQQALGLVAFDAGNGLKLLDMTMPADSLEERAKSIVSGVSQACVKRQQSALQKKNVCLLAVRNAELPREMDGFCTALGLLLERALLHSRGITMLERSRLELVNRERSLPVAEESKELWSSVVLLELDVRRADNGRDLRVVCHLSNVTGQKLGFVEATGVQTNADSLSRELAGRITESLQVASAGAEANPLVEASRFFNEAQMLHSHGDRSEAIAQMHAACALAPTNKAFRAALNSFLIGDATHLVSEAGSTFHWAQYRERENKLQIEKKGREQITKALDEVGPVLAEYYANDKRWLLDKTDFFEFIGPFNQVQTFILQLRRIYNRGNESQQRRIQTIIDEDFNHVIDRIEIALLRAMDTANAIDQKTANAIDQNTEAILYWLSFNRDFPLNPGDYHRCFVKIATTWLKMMERIYHRELTAQKIDWHHGNDYKLVGLIWQECTGINFKFWYQRTEPTSIMNEASIKIGEAMARNPYPLIRLYGHAIELHNALRSNSLPPDITQQQRIEFKEAALNILLIKPLYKDVDFLFQKLFPDTNELYEAQVELCDMALSNHVIYEGLQDLINKEPDPAIKLKWIKRVLVVNALPDTHIYPYRRNLVATEFEQLRNKVLGIPVPVSMPIASAEPPLILPWTNVQKVFDVTSVSGLSSFDLPVMDGNAIYVLGHGEDREHNGPFIKLLKIYLPDGVVQQLGDIDYYGNGWDACLGNGHFYAAMDLPNGIYDFPLGPGEVRTIDRNNGLPSAVVHSIAYLDGRLYAGLGGDGYIISYDLASNRCLVLASSRRREKLSPLDNGPPFQTDYMFADPQRRRVLFHISGQQEIWQIDQDNTIRLYTKITTDQPGKPRNKLKRAGPVLEDEQRLSFYYTINRAVVCNLANDEYEIIATSCLATEVNRIGAIFMLPVHRVVGKWLWTASPFARMDLVNMTTNVTTEIFPGLEREGKGAGFDPTQCIFPFNNGKQLLLGDDKSLWLVDLISD